MKIRGYYRRLKNGKKIYVKEHERRGKNKTNTEPPKKSKGEEYKEHLKRAAQGLEEYRRPQTAEEIAAWDEVARQNAANRNKKRNHAK